MVNPVLEKSPVERMPCTFHKPQGEGRVAEVEDQSEAEPPAAEGCMLCRSLPLLLLSPG